MQSPSLDPFSSGLGTVQPSRVSDADADGLFCRAVMPQGSHSHAVTADTNQLTSQAFLSTAFEPLSPIHGVSSGVQDEFRSVY